MALRNANINMSSNQQKRMSRGLRSGNGLNMRISAVNMTGPFPVMVTAAQFRRINTARKNRKGMMLKFTARQMREMGTPVSGGIAPLLALALAAAGGILAGVGRIAGQKLGKKIFGKGPQSGRFLPRATNLPRTATPRNLPITSPILRPGNIFEPDPRDVKFQGASRKSKTKRVRGVGLVPLGTGALPRQRRTGTVGFNNGRGLVPLGVTPRPRKAGPLRSARTGQGFQVLGPNVVRPNRTRRARNKPVNYITRGGQDPIQQLIRSLPLTKPQKKRLAR